MHNHTIDNSNYKKFNWAINFFSTDSVDMDKHVHSRSVRYRAGSLFSIGWAKYFRPTKFDFKLHVMMEIWTVTVKV